jgi:hypothetical protein
LNKNPQGKQTSASKDSIPTPTRKTESGMRLAGMSQTSAHKVKNSNELDKQSAKVEATYNNFIKSPTPSLD